MNYAILIAVLVLIAGCASSHNMRTDGANALGGGYYEDAVREGLYYVQAKTNFAPYVNGAGAFRMWRKRAKDLCRSSDYRELGIREWNYETVPRQFIVMRYIVTVREGFALCANAGMSEEDARAIIRSQCSRFGTHSCDL